MTLADAWEYLDSNKKSLLDLLRDLIGFKTVAPPGAMYHEVIDYLQLVFEDLGFSTEKILMPEEIFEAKCTDPRLIGDRPNLRARLDAGAKETLVIYTHVDVVPPGDNWSTDPFDLTVEGGKAYGRGVSDSKGAVAGMIMALGAVMGRAELKYNLEVLLTTDEEVGGYSGLCYFADQGLIEGDKMLCMDTFSDNVVVGTNGIITWEVTVRGVSAHSGTSFLGVNAIEKSLPVMETIMDLKREVEARESSIPASSGLREIGHEKLRPMVNITMINGGIKENIVPNSCWFRGDRRVIPEETMEGAMEEFEGRVRSLAADEDLGLDLDLKFWPGYPPMRIPQDHPWVVEVMDAVGNAVGTRPEISGMQGSIDQAYASEVTRIPACAFGVGRQVESNAHGADENVRLVDLENYARFMAALIAK